MEFDKILGELGTTRHGLTWSPEDIDVEPVTFLKNHLGGRAKKAFITAKVVSLTGAVV